MKIFTISELVLSNRSPTTVLSFKTIYRLIESAKVRYPESFSVIVRGLSSEVRPIYELVVRDPGPGPRQVLAWNLDPHAIDEDISLTAGLSYAFKLLENPEHLRGRECHFLISSPDDLVKKNQKRIDTYNNTAIRQSRISRQSGLSEDLPGKTRLGSSGWKAVDAMLLDIVRRVGSANDGSVFRLFVSGHNALVGTGAQFHIGGPRAKQIGLAAEAVSDAFSMPLSNFIADALHLGRIEGTRASYGPDTAQARRNHGLIDKVNCTDVELAHHYASQYGLEVNTAVYEIPDVVIHPSFLPPKLKNAYSERIHELDRKVSEELDELDEYVKGFFLGESFLVNEQIRALEDLLLSSIVIPNNEHQSQQLSDDDRLMLKCIRSWWTVRHINTVINAAEFLAVTHEKQPISEIESRLARLYELRSELRNCTKALHNTKFSRDSRSDHFDTCMVTVEASFAASMGLPMELNFSTPALNSRSAGLSRELA